MLDTGSIEEKHYGAPPDVAVRRYLKVLVYEALSCWCIKALSYQRMRPKATSVCGLNVLVYEALS